MKWINYNFNWFECCYHYRQSLSKFIPTSTNDKYKMDTIDRKIASIMKTLDINTEAIKIIEKLIDSEAPEQ